jgi:uncharacterized protein YwqG
MLDRDAPLYADLAERLRAAGLGRVLDDVLALARPAVSLHLTRVDEATIPVGASKVGGTAELPPGAAWPEWRGLPLPFIAQVRLEEVAHLDPEDELPHRGLLSFFYAMNDPDGGLHLDDGSIHWHVRYTEDTTTLERRPLPQALVGGMDTAFPACAVAPRRRLSLPPDENAVAAARGFTNDERLGLIDIVTGDRFTSFDDEMDHRLLGYPYTLNNPRPFSKVHLEGAADDDWRLLLQVYSNEEAVMDWAGGGVIHFGIARADLAARDFSRVWLNLDFV